MSRVGGADTTCAFGKVSWTRQTAEEAGLMFAAKGGGAFCGGCIGVINAMGLRWAVVANFFSLVFSGPQCDFGRGGGAASYGWMEYCGVLMEYFGDPSH